MSVAFYNVVDEAVFVMNALLHTAMSIDLTMLRFPSVTYNNVTLPGSTSKCVVILLEKCVSGIDTFGRMPRAYSSWSGGGGGVKPDAFASRVWRKVLSYYWKIPVRCSLNNVEVRCSLEAVRCSFDSV